MRVPAVHVIRIVVALFSVACLVQTGRELGHRFADGYSRGTTAPWRAVARAMSEGPLGLWCSSDGELSSVDRSRLIAISWERFPVPPVPVFPGTVPSDFVGPVPTKDMGPVPAKTVGTVPIKTVGTVPICSLGTVPDRILSSAYLSREEIRTLEISGYKLIQTNDYVAVWTMGTVPGGLKGTVPQGAEETMGTVPQRAEETMGTVPKGVGTGSKGWGQELLGVVIVGMGLVVGWCVWRRRCGLRVTGGDLIGAGVVFGLLAAVVLLHPLTAPNGLGVYAGKAKLWLMSGGIPADFGTNPAYAVLQPAYPPGLTLLALFADKVGGVCGDWLIQLLSAVCGGLLLLTLSVGRERSGWGKLSLVTLPTLAFVLSPIAVRMFSGVYAEPFAALLLVMGARAIGTGRNGLGWTLMGCAALFRTEAAFLAFFFWLFLRLLTRREGKCPVASWRGLLSVIGPALLWQVVCLYMGAQVYDFDFTSFPSFARVGSAMLAALGAAFAGCLQNGAVVPLTVVGVLAAWQLSAARDGTRAPRPAVPSGYYAGGCLSGNTAALLAAVAAVMAGTLILGFNVSSQFDWILRQTMPRFIWLAAALLPASLHFPSDFSTVD